MTTNLNYRRAGNKSRCSENHSEIPQNESNGKVDEEASVHGPLDGPLEVESSNRTSRRSCDDRGKPDRTHLQPIAITSVPWACEADSSNNVSVTKKEVKNAYTRNDVAEVEGKDGDNNDEDDIESEDTRALLANQTLITGKASALLGSKDEDEETETQVTIAPPLERHACLPSEKIGNCTVVLPTLYRRTNGWLGIVGPHWYGSLCTLGILWGAGGHFTYKAFGQALYYIHSLELHRGAATDSAEADFSLGWRDMAIAWFKPTICCCFLIFGTVCLGLTCCANPGIVTEANCGYAQYQQDLAHEASEVSESGDAANVARRRRRAAQFRWCDICRVHQPSHALHCPDCNVCIAHYDHHCPWMGTCIGGSNMKPFIRFNLSWLFFLIFVLAFVAFADPPTVKAKRPKLSLPPTMTKANETLAQSSLVGDKKSMDDILENEAYP